MAWTIRQMDDFAGWPVWGWLSPGGIPCLNPVFHLGPFRSACGPYRCSHRAGCRRPRSVRRPWQIGHTAEALSAAPQEVAVAAQLQGWMLARGISGACQITSEHFWIDGGDCGEGRAVSLVAARPRRVLLLWCISGSRAIPGHCRAIHVPSSLLKAKGIERGWL
jgi:hypothetical protein